MGRVSGREGNPGKIRAVDDVRVGAVLRALRIRRDLRQVDVARMASVSRSVVSLVERGYLARTNVASLRSIAGVLEATIDLVPRWRGAEIDRLLNAALPRIRDFHGVATKAFDGRGNFSLGVREQLIFPEIDYDKVDRIRGMQINIVTTARTDEEGRRLLEMMGMPFAKERT